MRCESHFREGRRSVTDNYCGFFGLTVNSSPTLIDRLVYELYGLTEDEIKIVEGSNAGPASAVAEP